MNQVIGPMADAAARKREIAAAVAWTKQHVTRVLGKSVVEIRDLADKNKTAVPVPDGTTIEKTTFNASIATMAAPGHTVAR